MAPSRLLVAAASAALAAALVACTGGPPGTAPDEGRATPSSGTPSALTGGLGPTLVETLAHDPSDRGLDHVRAFLVLQDGRPVFEHYRESTPEATYDVDAVTMSVVSVLVGIAIDKGYIEGLQQTLGELLPEYSGSMSEDVASVTVEELLTMTGGLLDEPMDLGGPGDVVAQVLADGLSFRPGDRFVHSRRSAHLLSAVLAEATGSTVLEFAREQLFDPLGIVSEPAAEPAAVERGSSAYDRAGFAWPVDPQGRHLGAAGLKITASDMARVGQLMADGGRSGGQQIVPFWWVAESTSRQVTRSGTFRATKGYGYQWWVATADGHRAFAALGHGGQLIEVVPELDLVVAVASSVPAGDPLEATALLALVDDVVAPALAR
ncbi:CubicO group peptidase (beta-lactamase class C family) [Georgenia soli]|uniref:CubicO group peptidase (Beta-lactamase class C family) n=1 Tax=Georgenia soli TaxID=638953 RepID=A0A2A9EGP4_9MICO|nr:serine hydrolase [Georgenia soli]PFG38094.1 CubicO group peptidase (beta-lactamase class C family) [Georgenia soli]